MPDRVCPVCGEKLIKDGFVFRSRLSLDSREIKEPDIDLNFSGDYQSKRISIQRLSLVRVRHSVPER